MQVCEKKIQAWTGLESMTYAMLLQFFMAEIMGFNSIQAWIFFSWNSNKTCHFFFAQFLASRHSNWLWAESLNTSF